jgi:hypothetical protein
MKKIALYGFSFTLVAVLVLAVFPAGAAKPQTAIEISNGMPSGDHETLLIHGKKDGYICEECEICETCDPPVLQCNVINMPEYGTATIKYVSGKKVQIDELTVFDSCAGWEGDNDIAEVWLPYEEDGYWVFMRALGKPGKGDNERYICLENDSLEAYPLLTDVSNPDDVILPLGLITDQAGFKTDPTGNLSRFAKEDKGKGKAPSMDITDMFLYSGFVFAPVLDINVDGSVDELDVIADCCPADEDQSGIIENDELTNWLASNTVNDIVGNDGVNALDVIATTCSYDTNQNGLIDYDGNYDADTFPDCEFENWLFDNQYDTYGDPLWQYYDEEWIFTIADLVYLNQVVTNQGIKNTQIRFYPKDTTIFTPSEPESTQ